ncbi:GLPGLI family protein [uncultured Lacinutrix sp.]|uniref:GLPGLI family protein n=1 Tax=uncultured Lacinutrix sp. TaxID=574032 RepID=UPI002622FE98|nr:GLPGLI family protein [uncultured Lacinutrix sp.]
MRSITIKTILASLAIFTSVFTFAQADFQGVATYESKTTMDMDGFGGRQMSPERKKMIMERMKSFLEKTYTLTFNRSESTYAEEQKLAAPGAGMGRFGGFASSFTDGAKYKNVKEAKIIEDKEFFGKQFLITDDLTALEWKMTGETKKIGQYMCMKAVAMKPVDEMDWSNMRRRRGNRDGKKEENKGSRSIAAKDGTAKKINEKVEVEEKTEDTTKVDTVDLTKNPLDLIETPKEVEVVAWYTMQIPVNQGPGEYWGLPGLILEVNSGKTTILCSKIVMNPDEKEEIKRPAKGKEVTRKEYNEIIKKKMEEMREMYGGRNRGGRRGF